MTEDKFMYNTQLTETNMLIKTWGTLENVHILKEFECMVDIFF